MCTASKAIGQAYGAGKGAYLVPVKMGDMSFEASIQGWQEVLADIKAHPERQKRSIVTSSIVTRMPESEIDPQQKTEIREALMELFKIGVPVVISAGNYALDKHGNLVRPNVDTIPPVLAEPDFPLIVVGNADAQGNIYRESQRGPKVTVWARGTNALCQMLHRVDINTGTSFCTVSLNFFLP